MKASELAKILLANPDAEVVQYQYNGGGDPLFEVNTAILERKGVISESRDGGHCIGIDGVVTKDIIILSYDPTRGSGSIPYSKNYYFD